MSNDRSPIAAARELMRTRGPELIRRYEAGESLGALSRDTGLSKSAISKMLVRSGVQLRPRGSHANPDRIRERQAEIRRRYEDGDRLAEIAADVGVSFTTARLDLIAAGGQTRGMGGFKATPLRGAKNPSWSGGRHRNRDGYWLVWVDDDHPFASMRPKRTCYVFEHRLRMAEMLGRPLERTETVHHINGDKDDNRVENLQLRSGMHGQGVRLQCRSCGSHDVETVAL